MSARLRRDDGFTLVEVVVSMGIMSIVLSVVIGAIAQIYSATNRVDTTSYDRSQLTIAFRRLDTELRYATWLNEPGQVGDNYYVEYALSPTSCRELKFGGGVLTLYSWTQPSDTPANPVALASNVTLSGTAKPFVRNKPGSMPYATAAPGTAGVGPSYAPEHAQLRLQFNAVTGSTTVPFDTIFTAENTSRNTSDDNDCRYGRPTS